MSEFNVGLTVVSSLWNDTGNAAVSGSVNAIGAMSQQAASIGVLQQSIGFVSNAWQTMGLIGQAVFVGLQKLSSGLYWLLARIVQGLEWVGKQFGIAEIGAAKFFDEISAGMSIKADESWQKLGVMANSPWNSEKVDKFFADARAKTAALQKDLAKSPAAMGAMKSPVMEAGGPKLASAIVAGSKEANNAILMRPVRRRHPGQGAGRGDGQEHGEDGGPARQDRRRDRGRGARLGGREIAFAAMAGNF